MDCKGLKRGLNFLPVAVQLISDQDIMMVTMVIFSIPRPWSWQWSWTACTEESATRASTQTQSSSTRRSASFLFVRKVLKVFKKYLSGRRKSRLLKPAELHRRHICALCPTSAWRDWQKSWGGQDENNWIWKISFFRTFSIFLYPLLQQFSSKVKPYVLDDQLCDECQGGRYSDE